MNNAFEKIGHEVLHVVEYPFVHTEQFVAVLGEALTAEPAVKASVIELVKLGEAVVSDGTIDYATKGVDLPTDLATVTAIQAFFAYFGATFLPVVEKAFKAIKADVQPVA